MSDPSNTLVKYDCEGTRAYLSMIQDVINRLSNNSANCKAWCVTIVAAIIVLAIDKDKPKAGLISLLPVSIFCFLDIYYLSLERDFRNIYNSFIDKLKNNTATERDLYMLTPPPGFIRRIRTCLEVILSPPIYAFYIVMVFAIILLNFVVKPATTSQP